MTDLSNKEIAALRVDYSLKTFDETHVLDDPFKQFSVWFKEALDAQVNEPNAMTLATVKPNNTPSARIVLLKGITPTGFTFFTNYSSHKGQQLEQNPNAALVFCWLELHRQVRVEGTIEKLSAKENDEYFYSRPVGSQLGAIASPQSKPLQNRLALEQLYKNTEATYQTHEPVRPEHWGGYVVKPTLIEFWQGRSNRLHDRFEFSLTTSGWVRQRLAP